jgi:hypothetical protein
MQTFGDFVRIAPYHDAIQQLAEDLVDLRLDPHDFFVDFMLANDMLDEGLAGWAAEKFGNLVGGGGGLAANAVGDVANAPSRFAQGANNAWNYTRGNQPAQQQSQQRKPPSAGAQWAKNNNYNADSRRVRATAVAINAINQLLQTLGNKEYGGKYGQIIGQMQQSLNTLKQLDLKSGNAGIQDVQAAGGAAPAAKPAAAPAPAAPGGHDAQVDMSPGMSPENLAKKKAAMDRAKMNKLPSAHVDLMNKRMKKR